MPTSLPVRWRALAMTSGGNAFATCAVEAAPCWPIRAWPCCAACARCISRRRRIRERARIAQRLTAHPKLGHVLYPGLPTHPGHAIAARQMQGGYGGMMSLRLAGGESAAIAFAAKLRVWKRATSLGSVESLVEHRASVEGPGTLCPPDLVRLSVGVEHVDDLIADIEQALA
jgi:cystathionine gamma-synthase